MELWIRSQDKKHLMKVEAIMYEETGTGYGLRVFTKNYDFNIASYKTKERALEVLDEIQKRLRNNILFKESSLHLKDGFNKLYIPYEESSKVYEMPKE